MLLQLISLVLLPFAVNGIGFGGCGCGMQIPPICLPSLPRIQLPSLCPPPSCGCGRKKRQVIRSPEVVASDDRKCTNDQLKEIILNGIKKNQSQAMSVIHSEVRAKLGGNWVVVCAPEPVSFVTQSQLYCLDGHDGTWCYAFKID